MRYTTLLIFFILMYWTGWGILSFQLDSLTFIGLLLVIGGAVMGLLVFNLWHFKPKIAEKRRKAK